MTHEGTTTEVHAVRMGPRLRQLRVKRQLTQVQLAAKVGVTQSYIGQIERGEKVPTLAVARALAKALGVTVDALID